MIRSKIMAGIIIGMSIYSFSQDNVLLTNVHLKCSRVYQDRYMNGRARSPEGYFQCVRGGGVDFELEGIHLERFMDLVNIVSNNYRAIVSNWYGYETNEVARFTVLSAIGYLGYNSYTNFVDKILAYSESNTQTNYFRSLNFIMCPYGTRQECKLALNYENAIVSNLFLRFKAQAVKNADTNNINWCDEVLSGEWKRSYLDEEATMGGL